MRQACSHLKVLEAFHENLHQLVKILQVHQLECRLD